MDIEQVWDRPTFSASCPWLLSSLFLSEVDISLLYGPRLFVSRVLRA
jgi:hypothetical protein